MPDAKNSTHQTEEPCLGFQSLRRMAVVLLAFTLLGALPTWLTTTQGVGVLPDSLVYLAAADAVRSGEGVAFFREQNHYPPLYPVLIAAFAQAGDLEQGARWLHILCAAASAVGMGLILWQLIRPSHKESRALLGSLAGGWLLVSADDFLLHFSILYSEAVFFAFMLPGLAAALAHLQSGRKPALILASLCFAACLMTRYAAAFLAPGVGVGILLLGQGSWRQRLVNAFILNAIAIIPLVLFKLALSTGDPTGREMAWHFVSAEQWSGFCLTVANWFLPYRLASPATGFVCLAITSALLTVWSWRQRRANGEWRTAAALISALGLLLFSHIAFIFLCISAVDYSLHIEFARHFLASHVVALAALIGIAAAPQPQSLPAVRWGAILLLSVAAFTNSVRFVKVAPQLARDGAGYSSRAWQESPTLQFVQSLSANARIHADNFESIRHILKRPCERVPEAFDPHSVKPNPEFDAQMNRLIADLNQGGWLVLFHKTDRWYQATLEDIQTKIAITPVHEFEDAAVYQAKR